MNRLRSSLGCVAVVLALTTGCDKKTDATGGQNDMAPEAPTTATPAPAANPEQPNPSNAESTGNTTTQGTADTERAKGQDPSPHARVPHGEKTEAQKQEEVQRKRSM